MIQEQHWAMDMGRFSRLGLAAKPSFAEETTIRNRFAWQTPFWRALG
jgi:hypothetical protein